MLLFNGTGKVEKVGAASDFPLKNGVAKKFFSKKIENIFLGRIAWFLDRFFPFFMEYKHKIRVTFGFTNYAGFVGHEKYANLFGSVRELFGLSRIPSFEKDAGHKYLLKTCDARYRHFSDFKFGDIIKTIIDVVEVNGASFQIRGRFTDNRTGEVRGEAHQRIVYTNMMGKPTRFPSWMRILLKLSERSIKREESPKFGDVRQEVFRYDVAVTSTMTNAERNTNHDEYAKKFEQIIELFTFSCGFVYSVKVEDASYKFCHDFFFGDKMVIKLFIVEIGTDWVVFEADFCDSSKVRVQARQKVHFVNQAGEILGIVPQGIKDTLY